MSRASLLPLGVCIGLAFVAVSALGEAPSVLLRREPIAPTRPARAHLPSPVIFPDQSIPLRFDHGKHLALGVACTGCHEAAAESVRAADLLTPREEVCVGCHQLDVADPDHAEAPAAPSACGFCHLGYEQPKDFPPPGKTREATSDARPRPAKIAIATPNLKMNHKAHVARQIACTQCHGTLTAVTLATRDNALPTMGTCLGCHDGKTAPNACSTCHVTTATYKVQTQYRTGQLMPAGWYRNDAHDETFFRNHSVAARADEGYCASCHTERFCLDCHNGVRKPMRVHPNNWVVLHPISARKASLACNACHRTQSFCVECHQRTQVSVESDSPFKSARNPAGRLALHPAGWVGDKGTRGASHHSFQAQRNIRACASCHTEATCLRCHASVDGVPDKVFSRAGGGINPHPRDFAERCRAMAAKNAGVCGKCHAASSAAMLKCR